MAKAKSKNNIKINDIKKNNVVTKKGTKTVANKKTRQPKKNIQVDEEIKKEVAIETNIVKKPATKSKSKNVPKKMVSEKKELTQEEIIAQRKERNRKKYQNQQKKYQENQKNKEKKKVVVEDQVNVKERFVDTTKETELVKKIQEKKKAELKEEEREEQVQELEQKLKEQERKEKRRKHIQFTQTLTTIRERSFTRINIFKEKTNDKNIPVGTTIEEKTKRSKRFIKEAIIYAIILTIINVICILVFDYFNFLRLFDIKALNVVVTILLSLIFNFFVAFMIDYFVTNIWLKNKRKKKVGEQNGDNRFIQEEYREDIENQE